ncbi:MAG: DUF6067 family protein [Kiritimatiellae bacterium]|nr:DUF6067 family protein [Kiritimatiellia bacterium]
MNRLFHDNWDRVPVGVPRYGVGEWDHLVHGNHRAVVKVTEKTSAVCAYLPWRRRDRHPECKHVRVVDAATAAVVANSLVVACNREYGEVVFEPVSGAGIYHIYYFVPAEDVNAHAWPRWAFPITRYKPPCCTASPAWLAANNLTDERIRSLPPNEVKWDPNYVMPEGEFPSCPGKVYPAGWRSLPQANLVEFQSRTEFDSFYPMEVVATQAERLRLEHLCRYRPMVLFPEGRLRPIRMTDALPQHWAVRRPEDLDGFTDTVCRNEYFIFQVGVYAHKGTVVGLKVSWSGLKGPGGGEIPPSAITCLNTEGTDQRGKRFVKTLHVETRKVQALWFGVDIPRDATPGRYEGTVRVGGENAEGQVIRLSLEITDEILPDHGDSDHWRLSRLRWLNSTLGLDDETCPPYTDVQVKGLKASILGREIELGQDGFPARLVSFIEMFATGERGRDILAAPVRASAMLEDGKATITLGGCALASLTPAQATFRSASPSGSVLHATHETAVESEGVIVSRIRIRAERSISLKTMRLDVRLPADVARLILWPSDNPNGDACPESYEIEAHKLARLWIGDYNAGLALRLPPGENGWVNRRQGRLRLTKDATACAMALESGPMALAAGEEVEFTVEFYVTPFHPLPRAHWNWRYDHAPYSTSLDIPQGIAAGATIFTQHHDAEANPYICYPLLTADRLKQMADQVHEAGGLFKFYDTVRELSVRAPELWALRSLGNEILSPSVDQLGYDDLADLPLEYQLRNPYLHPFTGMPWMGEHGAGSGYRSCWHSVNKSADLQDGSLMIDGASRWSNFFIESLRWLMQHAGLDGLYFDGHTFDRVALRRVRKVLLRGKPQALIDNHGGPSDMDRTPFYDSLWFGEGADYSKDPDYWLTAVSGIPFGLPGEMLMSTGGAVRGMIYGMSHRYGWSGPEADPSELWRWWSDFDIANARMIGYWQDACPVKVNHARIKATAYLHPGKRFAVVLASWADAPVTVSVDVDWQAIGLSSGDVVARMPEIAPFQHAREDVALDAVTIEPGKGWIVEVNRKGAHE